MKEEVAIFLRRAKVFETDAKHDFERGDFDICMFHLEQAAQLLIKAKLLDIKGLFERTHSLRRLLSDLAKIWKKKEIMDFIKRNRKVLRDLERAYVSARYISEEFFEDEVKEAFRVVKELRDLLWKE